ncbi:MAG: hypothetical protein GY757_43015 [bacterium]|nr:hypothetical protein [bacterium]
MKKLFLTILIIVVMGSLAFSEENDIRQLNWGMSYEKVKDIEGLTHSFYKAEELLNLQVEVVFGSDLKKGLISVIYSCSELIFVDTIKEKLTEKYGEPKKDMDYSFLIEAQEILKRHPRAALDILLEQDFSEFNKIDATSSDVDESKIIKGGLAKRSMWEYGKTTVLLLNNVTGGILSYRPKTEHLENKKKFTLLVEELKVLAKKNTKKKKKAAKDNI